MKPLTIDTRRANKHFNDAAVAFNQGDFHLSAECYRLGLGVDPSRVTALLDLAKAYEQVGDWRHSLEALDRALALDAHHAAGLRRHARVLEEQAVFEALEVAVSNVPAPNPMGQFELHVDVPDDGVVATVRRALSAAAQEFDSMFNTQLSRPVPVRLAPRQHQSFSGLPLWVSGAALADGSVALVVPEAPVSFGLIVALVRHELAHLYVRQAASGHCPHWLDESLACACAKPMMNWERVELATAARDGRQHSIEALDRDYSEIPPSAVGVTYQHFAAIGHWLTEVHGWERIALLLQALKRGETLAVVLREMVGISPDEIRDSALEYTVSKVVEATA